MKAKKRGTYLKMLNRRNLFVDVKVEYASHTLWWSDVVPIDEMFYFVVLILKCSSIWSFVNVFKAIFHGTEGCNGFNISVIVIFCREERVIGHNPSIIYPDRFNT